MQGIYRKRKAQSGSIDGGGSWKKCVSLLPLGVYAENNIDFSSVSATAATAAVTFLYCDENDENSSPQLLSAIANNNSNEEEVVVKKLLSESVPRRSANGNGNSRGQWGGLSYDMLSTLDPLVYWQLHVEAVSSLPFVEYIAAVGSTRVSTYLREWLEKAHSANTVAHRSHVTDMLFYIFQCAYGSEALCNSGTAAAVREDAHMKAVIVLEDIIFKCGSREDGNVVVVSIDDIMIIDRIRNIIKASSDRDAVSIWETNVFFKLLNSYLGFDCSNYDTTHIVAISKELSLFSSSVVQAALERELRRQPTSVASSSCCSIFTFLSDIAVGVSAPIDLGMQPLASFYLRRLLQHDVGRSANLNLSADLPSTQRVLDVVTNCCGDAVNIRSNDLLSRSLFLLWHISQLLDSVAGSGNVLGSSIMDSSGCKLFHRCFRSSLEGRINIHNSSDAATAMTTVCALLGETVASLPLAPLRLICKCVSTYRGISETAFQGLLFVARGRIALIEGRSRDSSSKDSSKDDKDDPIGVSVTPEKVRSWYDTLAKVRLLPVSVTQLCASAPAGASLLLKKLRVLHQKDPALAVACTAIAKAMVASTPPLCSEHDARIFTSPQVGLVESTMEGMNIDQRCVDGAKKVLSLFCNTYELLLESPSSQASSAVLPALSSIDSLCAELRESLSVTVDTRSKRYLGTLYSVCLFRIASGIARCAKERFPLDDAVGQRVMFLRSWMTWSGQLVGAMMSSELLHLSFLSLLVAFFKGVDIDLQCRLQGEGSLANAAASTEGVGLLLASLLLNGVEGTNADKFVDIMVGLAGYVRITFPSSSGDTTQNVSLCIFSTKMFVLLCASAYWLDKISTASINCTSFKSLFISSGDDLFAVLSSRSSGTFILNTALSASMTIERSNAMSPQSQVYLSATSLLNSAMRIHNNNDNDDYKRGSLFAIYSVVSRRSFLSTLLIDSAFSRGSSYLHKEGRIAFFWDRCELSGLEVHWPEIGTGLGCGMDELQHVCLLLLRLLQDFLAQSSGSSLAIASGEERDFCAAVATVAINKIISVAFPSILTGESAVFELIQNLKKENYSEQNKDLCAFFCHIVADKLSDKLYISDYERVKGRERLRSGGVRYL